MMPTHRRDVSVIPKEEALPSTDNFVKVISLFSGAEYVDFVPTGKEEEGYYVNYFKRSFTLRFSHVDNQHQLSYVQVVLPSVWRVLGETGIMNLVRVLTENAAYRSQAYGGEPEPFDWEFRNYKLDHLLYEVAESAQFAYVDLLHARISMYPYVYDFRWLFEQLNNPCNYERPESEVVIAFHDELDMDDDKWDNDPHQFNVFDELFIDFKDMQSYGIHYIIGGAQPTNCGVVGKHGVPEELYTGDVLAKGTYTFVDTDGIPLFYNPVSTGKCFC